MSLTALTLNMFQRTIHFNPGGTQIGRGFQPGLFGSCFPVLPPQVDGGDFFLGLWLSLVWLMATGNWFILSCFLDLTSLAYICKYIHMYVYIYVYICFQSTPFKYPILFAFHGTWFLRALAYFCLFSEVHLSCWHLSLFSATLLTQPLPVASQLRTTVVLLV